MFLCGPGKYQDVVNKDDNKIIKIFAEDVLYQMHELTKGRWLHQKASPKIHMIPNEFEMRS